MRSSHRLELLGGVCHPFLQGEKLLIEWPDQLRAQRGELGLFVVELTDHRGAKLGDALGEDDPILAQEPADVLDQCGAGLDEPLADPMQRLEILRLQLFHRHNAPGGPRHGFTDGFGIAGVMLR
jgi:hypothetical protein